ncbi:MAG: sigma-70 family RNA polymerase sigma factor [Planctomycetes bacterium]|nr:sigma-70 family RNA polymerase sigma factor [Planctomycetota bacterium]
MKKWKRVNDIKTKEHIGLVIYTMRKDMGIYKWNDDMLNAGVLGLCKAAKRWKPIGEVGFAAYAIIWIRGEISKYLRSLGNIRKKEKSVGDLLNVLGEVGSRVTKNYSYKSFDNLLNKSNLTDSQKFIITEWALNDRTTEQISESMGEEWSYRKVMIHLRIAIQRVKKLCKHKQYKIGMKRRSR